MVSRVMWPKLSPARLFAALTWMLALHVAAPSVAIAQGSGSLGGVRGVVRDREGRPLSAATVEARHQSSGTVVRAVTGESGRFALLDLPLGRYRITARRVGYALAAPRDMDLAIGDRQDVALTLDVVSADTVRVSARRESARDARLGGSTVVSRVQIDALPVPDRNFTSLAALSSRSGPQLSLSGQRWTGTDIRLDGIQARNMLRAGEVYGGPSGIPLDAVREFEVNTTVFDAAKGRQGGGELSAATRMGTNDTQGRITANFRNEQLSASTDFQDRTRQSRAATVSQLAISGSGAIVRDRAHWFIAAEQQQSSEPLRTGDVSTSAAQISAGIARDSLNRIIDILGRQYGTDTAAGQVGALARRPVSRTLFARADWQLSDRNRVSSKLTASSWDNPLSGGVDQAIALREARSSFASHEWQWTGEWSSQLSATVHHGAQLAVGGARRTLSPESPNVPRGFVQVRSLLPDGTTGNTTVQFGGNRLAPDDSREHTWQLRDRLDADTRFGLISVGMDHTLSSMSTRIAEAQSGLFVFPSIAALASNTPTRFTRTVPSAGVAPTTEARALEMGAFAQLERRLTSQLQVTAGLRWDGTLFLTDPPSQPAVDNAFGVQTGVAPRDLAQWQPRLQLIWRSNAAGTDVVRVGAGVFAAQMPYYTQHNTLLYTGQSVADIDLRNAAVPAPDFRGYRNGTAIPGASALVPPPPAYVNVNGTVRAPKTFKSTVAWSHQFPWSLTSTLSATLNRLRDGYQYLDRNLAAQPAFRLASEGNRGVWVPASTIVTTTGVTDVRNASRVAGYARVVSLESAARGVQNDATAELTWNAGARNSLQASYTWSDARDNSTYGCCLARTATTFTPVVDDPRNLSQAWGRADFDIRHRITANASAGLPWGMAFSVRYLGASGRPISLVTDGDINGDEANGNDLAFLFDPNNPSTPADIAASMRAVMANPRNIAGKYIASHLGQIAGRNAIETPWTHRYDARISRAMLLKGGRKAELILDVLNAANLLNRHWGAQYLLPLGISTQNPLVTRLPLLRVTGFDVANQRYRYTVNESAGVLPRGGDPYQLQLGMRFDW